MKRILLCLLIVTSFTTAHANEKLKKQIDLLAGTIESKVIEWRRHFHQFPELSNREFKTAEKIAEHLRNLGLDVTTGIAHTGVVALLKGAKPGPVVGLRADIDALPVTERVDVPFASEVRSTYDGHDVGVMHACGHDAHIAILMGVAEILSSMKKDLPGSVKFIFQPAEEGAPQDEEGGAELMVKEGVLENPKVDAIFGLHVRSIGRVGTISYRPQSIMAAVDGLRITVKGKQTHGSTPWTGIDPITVSAQIIIGLQTIISRQTELTEEAAVITIGSIHGGVRSNIIPEQVELIGTIRTLNTDMQDKIHEKIRLTATKIAESAGAVADVRITKGYPVTYNDPELTEMMLPSLHQVAGDENVKLVNAITGAEDFSFFQKKIPGLYFFLGAMPKGTKTEDAPPHHSPDFYIDESSFKLGIRALSYLTLDYMQKHQK
ncbi:MAG: amidohydrolase [Planctomycetes bacterium]|nr:amidohydrolase [Planctomycetota bacterium]MBL7142921.1 amidohydrolase [Phycisphaerae bacterium]